MLNKLYWNQLQRKQKRSGTAVQTLTLFDTPKDPWEM